MKKISLIILLLSILAACKKAEEMRFNSAANIHYDLGSGRKDSIIYTFAYKPTLKQDTVYLGVQLSGVATDKDRVYYAYVVKDSSTAKEGVHFEPLKAEYILPAGKGFTYLPVIIYNVADLENKSVSLIIRLKGSPDLGIQALTDDEGKDILRAKIVYSATLEKPDWWNMWEGAYYSRTKHQLFLIVTGETTLTTAGLDAPRNLYLVNMLTIMLNDPFKWVAKNAAKGYVLEQVVPGDDTNYNFYNVDNPNRPILLRKNKASGKYYFIDENGEEIN
jgi:hypothetical protein